MRTTRSIAATLFLVGLAATWAAAGPEVDAKLAA